MVTLFLMIFFKSATKCVITLTSFWDHNEYQEYVTVIDHDTISDFKPETEIG